MNTIDTIYLTGDMIAEKLCKCNDALPIIIQQTKEPCCDNGFATQITQIICVTIVVVVLLFILGWLIKPLLESCNKNKEQKNERKYQERESCIKLRQSYQSKLLEELQSANINQDYKDKLEKYIGELDDRIKELNKELGLIKS